MQYRKIQSFLLFISLFLPFGLLKAQETFKLEQDYIIESYSTGRALDIYEFSKENGAKIVFWNRHGGQNQIFRCEPTGDGYYLLHSVLSNKFIEIRNSEQGDNAVAQQWDYTRAWNQQFKMVPASNTGCFFIYLRHSNKVLQEQAGSNVGSTLTQTTFTGTMNQMFRFVPVNVAPAPPPPPPPAALTAPVLLSPANGVSVDIVNGEEINFDWQDVPQATVYQLFVRHQNGSDVLLNVDVPNSAYRFRLMSSLPESAKTGYWEWWVRAKKGSTEGPWNTTPWKINQKIITQPVVTIPTPQVTYPQANAIIENGSMDFEKDYQWVFNWTSVPGASTYEIYVGIPNQHDIYQTVQGATSYTVRHDKKAYFKQQFLSGWICKVRAMVNGNWGEWGPSLPFRLAAPKPPSAPPEIIYTYDQKYYWVECGYLHAFLATKQEVYSGRDLTFGPTNLVVEQKGEPRATLKLIAVKGSDQRYIIEVFSRDKYDGKLKSLGYLTHSLKVENWDENTWKIADNGSGFVRIYIPENNMALQVMDGTNYDPTITVQLKPLSGHQRQLFKLFQK